MCEPTDLPDESAQLGEQGQPTPTRLPPKWPIYVLLAAAVIVPGLFWRQVWFGADLSDEEIRRRLSQPERPREVQHACEQISRRMEQDPDGARQFYDLLVSLADHSDEEIRSVVAWCMGEDNTRHGPFHQALLGLVNDEAPRVRFNAALALVRFDDATGRQVLREMLMPYTVPAAREGQTLSTIEPSFQQVYEALRGLALVGETEDLQCIRRYFDPPGRFSRSQQDRVQIQARLTADAIQKRQDR